MSDHVSDHLLDAQLRDVPLPDGLVARLKASLAQSDEQVDAALRSVAIPTTVIARLREIPADVAVDEVLTDLAWPLAMIHALRRPTLSDRLIKWGRQVQRLVVAACWFVAVSAVLGGGLGAILSGTYPRGDEPEMVMIYNGPLSVAATQQNRDGMDLLPMPVSVAVDYPEDDEAAEPPGPPIARIDQPQWDDPPAPGPVAEWISLVASGLRPMDDAVLLRYGVLASPHFADDQLPDLVTPRLPRAAGVEPPLIRGYDRAFFSSIGSFHRSRRQRIRAWPISRVHS